MNNKYIYIGNDLIAGPIQHEKPKPFEYTEGDSIYPDDTDFNWANYQRDLKKWKTYIASLPKIEVNGTHSWEINQILVEDVDFFINNHHFEYTTVGATLKTVAIPIKLNTQYSEQNYSKGEKDLVASVQNSEGSSLATLSSSSSNSIEHPVLDFLGGESCAYLNEDDENSQNIAAYLQSIIPEIEKLLNTEPNTSSQTLTQIEQDKK